MPATHVVIGGDSLANLGTIRGSQPELRLEETDQVGPAGMYRLKVNNDAFTLDRATATDWSTSTSLLAMTTAGGLTISGTSGTVSSVYAATNRDLGLLQGGLTTNYVYMMSIAHTTNPSGFSVIDNGAGSGPVAVLNVFSSADGIFEALRLKKTSPNTVPGTNSTGIAMTFYLQDSTNTANSNRFSAQIRSQWVQISGSPTTTSRSKLVFLVDTNSGGAAVEVASIVGAATAAGFGSVTTGLVIGNGEGGATGATGYTVRAPDLTTTGGAGNVAGADLTVGSGVGTGTGAPGRVIIAVAPTAAAGNNIQTRGNMVLFTATTMDFQQATTISTTATTLTLAPNTTTIIQSASANTTPALITKNTVDNASVLVAQFLGARATPALGDEAHISYIINNLDSSALEVGRLQWNIYNTATGANRNAWFELLALQGGVLHGMFTYFGTAGVASQGTLNLNIDSLNVTTIIKASSKSRAFEIDGNTGDIGMSYNTDITNFDSHLHVWNATAGVVTAVAGTIITMENSSNAYLSSLAPAANAGGVVMGFADNNAYHSIIGRGSGNATRAASIDFTVAGTLRLNYAAGAFAFQEATTISSTAAGQLIFSGGLMIGANSTNNLFSTASTGAGSTAMWIGNAQITVVSDLRVKFDVRPYGGNALSLFHALPVIEYDMKDEYRPYGGSVYKGRYAGMTAQALYSKVPWAVNTQGGKDCSKCLAGLPCDYHPFWQVNYSLMAGLFVKGFQEIDDEVRTVKAQIAALEARLEILENP